MTDSTDSFFWDQTAARLAALGSRHDLALDDKRRHFHAPGIRVTPPLILPIGQRAVVLADYLAELPVAPTRHLIILMQAGASALGWFEGGDRIATKSDKKYVVRGRGHAQPTHLATKGKSRYGSRLRLQNARFLRANVCERIADWIGEFGQPDEVFYNVPVRLWSALFEARWPPPIDKATAIKIPVDLPVPTTETLLHAYRKMSYGRIERTASPT